MTIAAIHVVSYNLAAACEGVQWQLHPECMGYSDAFNLHGARALLLESYIQREAQFPVGTADREQGLNPLEGAAVPVVCLQESVLPALGGYVMLGTPAMTHAGQTSIFVPRDVAEGAHPAVKVERIGSAGPDNSSGTYDFPIASLLVQGVKGIIRVVITSVHLAPFPKNTDARRAQLERTRLAMVKMAQGTASSAGKGKKATPAPAAVRTVFIIAGDTNMRDNEGPPTGFADAFVTYQRDRPEDAWACQNTWDTSIGYNGPSGPRGDYVARYDRVFVRSEQQQQSTDAADTTTSIAGMRLLGTRPFVNPEWDSAAAELLRQFPSYEDEPLSRPADSNDSAQELRAAAKLCASQASTPASVAAAFDVDPSAQGAQRGCHVLRYLSDHFGLCAAVLLECGAATQM